MSISINVYYNWKFCTGDPPNINPPLQLQRMTSVRVNSSGRFYIWSKQIPADDADALRKSKRGLLGYNACRAACSTTPGCLAFQTGEYDFPIPVPDGPYYNNNCYIHGGTLGKEVPICVMGANKTKARGESRTVILPAIQDLSGVTFKDVSLNDSV